MQVERVVSSLLDENCYIISYGNKSIIVDPGSSYDSILRVLGNRDVLAILVTHNHFDHISSLDRLRDKFNVLVIDYFSLTGTDYFIDPFRFKVLCVPGHSMDSIIFYFEDEKVMFVGDFIFKGSVGRCDLEGGSYKLLRESISMIKGYSPDIVIYPGHGSSTKLVDEIENNIYFK